MVVAEEAAAAQKLSLFHRTQMVEFRGGGGEISVSTRGASMWLTARRPQSPDFLPSAAK